MKPWTKRQTVIAIAGVLLVVGVQAALQWAREDAGQPNAVTAGTTDSSGLDSGSNDAGFGFGGVNSSGVDSSNPDAGAAFGDAGQGPAGTGRTGSSDATSDGIVQRYNDAQQSEDRVFQGQDNLIKDEVTLQNPETGEVTQGQAGSNYYYQSQSVDSAVRESTIIGMDGGTPAPADATPLNIVGSDPAPAPTSSGDAGGTP